MKTHNQQKTKTTVRSLCLLFLLAVLHCSTGMAANEYEALDHLIEQRSAITYKKLLRIDDIRQRLFTPHLTDVSVTKYVWNCTKSTKPFALTRL